MEEKLSSIGRRGACAALRKLNENGGKMNSADLFVALGEELNIPPWALAIYSTNGYAKWEHAARNQVIKFVEAEFLTKKSGVWILTPEGEEFAAKSNAEILAETAKRCSDRSQEKAQKPADVSAQADSGQSEADVDSGQSEAGVDSGQSEAGVDSGQSEAGVDSGQSEAGVDSGQSEADVDSGQSGTVDTLDRFEGQARKGLEGKIRKMDPYVFQELVAALLRGMGYYVPYVSPRGADGGLDVLAYTDDPLGARGARIRVQVKRHKNRISPADVQQLAGLLTEGEIGVFVSTGGFTSGCERFAHNNPKHIDLIDVERFVDLWREVYSYLADKDRARLPLRFISFLDSERDEE